MKGCYNNEKPEERFIYEKDTQSSKNGFFKPEHFIESPGKAERLSLRIGLNRFSEGITLSYAETFDGSDNYSPFIPFAYLTDPEKQRPFILYYDPKIKKEGNSRGPIVLHRGFTSAFYDFQEDGTGRLVISIGCWLIRREEYLINLREGIVKEIPAIKKPEENNIIFEKWIKVISNEYDIVYMIDATGSMGSWIKAASDKCMKVSDELKIKFPNLDIKFEGIFYRDPIDSKADVHEVFNLTKDYESLKNNFSNVRAYGGGDGPEDWVGAYSKALNLNWRNGTKLIIHIADSPAHTQEFCGQVNHEEEAGKLPPILKSCSEKNIKIISFCINELARLSFNVCEKYYSQNQGFYKIFSFNDIESKTISDKFEEMTIAAAPE